MIRFFQTPQKTTAMRSCWMPNSWRATMWVRAVRW